VQASAFIGNANTSRTSRTPNRIIDDLNRPRLEPRNALLQHFKNVVRNDQLGPWPHEVADQVGTGLPGNHEWLRPSLARSAAFRTDTVACSGPGPSAARLREAEITWVGEPPQRHGSIRTLDDAAGSADGSVRASGGHRVKPGAVGLIDLRHSRQVSGDVR
jgi:hypothetical protein